jgi:sigma-B regulation protein RsbU (phosphoserine phosphatase)
MSLLSKAPDGSGDTKRLEDEVLRLRSAVQELAVLNDIAISASRSLEVDEVLEIIVDKSIKAVKAEQGSIMLVTEQQDAPLKTLIRQDDRTTGMVPYRVGINITGWVLQHQKPLVVDNLQSDERFKGVAQQMTDIKSVLAVPIRHRAKMVGILIVTNKKVDEPFSENDQRLLGIIASQSGQLIRNMQLQEESLEKKRMEQELGLARDIQMRLLPTQDPHPSHFDVAGYFRAADEVSGDYYDYFDLGDGKLGVVIADVSGHGASSALVMTLVKGILQATIARFESSAQVIADVNKIVCRTLPAEMFVTMLFMVFDAETSTLRFANAGHNPIVRYNAGSNEVVLEKRPAPAVGLTPLARYEEHEISLADGDIVVTYTDGLTEAFNSSREMFSEERLVASVGENSGGSASAIVQRLREDLSGFVGSNPQSDDVAIIAVKRVTEEVES